MMTIKPLGDRVLIEALEAETKTKSGIIIPDTAKEKSQEGIVIAIGDGTKKQKMTVKKVLFGKYSGSEIQIDGKKYMIMKETDIYGVLSEEEVKTVVV
jgi:chaperonin GroES